MEFDEGINNLLKKIEVSGEEAAKEETSDGVTRRIVSICYWDTRGFHSCDLYRRRGGER